MKMNIATELDEHQKNISDGKIHLRNKLQKYIQAIFCVR